jgi:hypothetical protein
VFFLFNALSPGGTELAREAALEWFQKPAAIRLTGRRDQTIVSYLHHSGRVMIRSLDHATSQWSDPVTLVDLKKTYQAAAIDDHNPPSLLALRDGTILAFTAVHDQPDALGVQRSLQSENISSWTPWQPVWHETGAEYDYPQAKELPDGRIILFFRRGTWQSATEAYSLSSDQGRTWSSPTALIDFGPNVGVYAFVQQQGRDIHLAWNVRRGGGTPSELYYAVSRDNGASWQTSTGQAVSLPLTAETGELISNSAEPLFTWDLQITTQGQPRIALVHGQPSSAQYAIAEKQAARWVVNDIVETRLLYGSSHYYAGGIVFNPANPDQVLISRGGSDLYLTLWERDQKVWRQRRVISAAFQHDAIRPQFVAGDPDQSFIWLNGRYTGYDGREWSGFRGLNLFYGR